MITLRNFGRIGYYAGLSLWRFVIWIVWLIWERVLDLIFVWLVIKGVTAGIAKIMAELFVFDRDRFFIIMGTALIIALLFWLLWLSW